MSSIADGGRSKSCTSSTKLQATNQEPSLTTHLKRSKVFLLICPNSDRRLLKDLKATRERWRTLLWCHRRLWVIRSSHLRASTLRTIWSTLLVWRSALKLLKSWLRGLRLSTRSDLKSSSTKSSSRFCMRPSYRRIRDCLRRAFHALRTVRPCKIYTSIPFDCGNTFCFGESAAPCATKHPSCNWT